VSRWAYSTAKALDETLAYAYHKERGLPTVVVRLFNTVGLVRAQPTVWSSLA
jgi:UDP-glucose 4-epimerase